MDGIPVTGIGFELSFTIIASVMGFAASTIVPLDTIPIIAVNLNFTL